MIFLTTGFSLFAKLFFFSLLFVFGTGFKRNRKLELEIVYVPRCDDSLLIKVQPETDDRGFFRQIVNVDDSLRFA